MVNRDSHFFLNSIVLRTGPIRIKNPIHFSTFFSQISAHYTEVDGDSRPNRRPHSFSSHISRVWSPLWPTVSSLQLLVLMLWAANLLPPHFHYTVFYFVQKVIINTILSSGTQQKQPKIGFKTNWAIQAFLHDLWNFWYIWWFFKISVSLSCSTSKNNQICQKSWQKMKKSLV